VADRLVVPADLAELGRVRAFVRERAADAGFDSTALGEIGLAVTEAVSNVIRHAYNSDASQDVSVEVNVDEQDLIIEIIDQGHTPDGLPEGEPDLDDPGPGGYGVYLIRTVMDEVQWSRQARGNVLRLRRRRLSPP
jgi:serine/threonine-protein kinase RsbW